LNRYLLDTNPLSACLDRQPALEQRTDAALRAGDRFGIGLPVLCAYRAGIRLSRRYRQNLARLQVALARFRHWPRDEQTAAGFAKLFQRQLPMPCGLPWRPRRLGGPSPSYPK
jgi:predicted nucleic acid-binding protein